MVRAATEGWHVETRAACATAYRLHITRLAAGHADGPSEEAEAGALIDASDAAEMRIHAARIEAVLQALCNVSGG